MTLTEQANIDWDNHILKEYPKEAVGIIVDNQYIALKNISSEPNSSFQFSAEDSLKYDIQAILHSHPYDKSLSSKRDPSWPSCFDLEQWSKESIPWGIKSTDGEGTSVAVWLDDNDRPELEGRLFVFGVTDCYTLARDYYHTKLGIDFPFYATEFGWWWTGKQNLYVESLLENDFRLLGPDELPQINDGVLFQYQADVVNHIAIITDTNTILHHLYGKFSGYDSLAKWNGYIAGYVRHRSQE